MLNFIELRLNVFRLHWKSILFLWAMVSAISVTAQEDSLDNEMSVEGFPILSYDSDAGIGYGAKIEAVNIFGHHEAFDLIVFNSTNGEQWYRFAAASPGAESRRGRAVPVFFEMLVDFDKWIANRFYGIGPESKQSEKEEYTREPLDILLMFGHGATPAFAVQGGIRYRSIRNSNISAADRLSALPPPVNQSVARCNSVVARTQYDTRNSVISTTRGTVISLETEWTMPLPGTNIHFKRTVFSLQGYRTVNEYAVLAGRLMIQTLSGKRLPVQVLASVGGNNTMRGYPQDRFLDYSSIVGNMECRIPILRRFGGVVGVDAGRVAPGLNKLSIRNFHLNGVAGVRYKMETFVVRLDAGVSSETTGVYLNFGELF